MCTDATVIHETPCYQQLQKKVEEITSKGEYIIPADMNLKNLPDGIVNGFLDLYNLLKAWPEMQKFLLFAIKRGIVTIKCTDHHHGHTYAPIHLYRKMRYYYQRHRVEWFKEKKLHAKLFPNVEEEAMKIEKGRKREELRQQQLSFNW